MDTDGVRAALRKEVEAAGGQAAWAAKHGVSASYVSAVLGGQEPGKTILDAMGFERVTQYAKREKRPVSSLLTELDLSDPENLKQCAFEMARRPAEQWRDKWGEALVRAAADTGNQDELDALTKEANELEAAKDRAISRMGDAATQLDRIASAEKTPPEIADKLDTVITLLDTDAI